MNATATRLGVGFCNFGPEVHPDAPEIGVFSGEQVQLKPAPQPGKENNLTLRSIFLDDESALESWFQIAVNSVGQEHCHAFL